LVPSETIQDLAEGDPTGVGDTDRIGRHMFRDSEGGDGIGEVVFVNCELI